MGYQLLLIRNIATIHLGAEVRLPRFEVHHRSWLRRVQQHMRERSLPLRELREANGHLWNAGRTFGEQSIRGKPRGSGILLGILAEPDINGIVVFGDVVVDVVLPTWTSISHWKSAARNLTNGDTTRVPVRPASRASIP